MLAEDESALLELVGQLSVSVELAALPVFGSHALFAVHVAHRQLRYTLLRRFSQVTALHASLAAIAKSSSAPAQTSGTGRSGEAADNADASGEPDRHRLPELPPKHALTVQTAAFLEGRARDLELFLSRLLACAALVPAHALPLATFFELSAARAALSALDAAEATLLECAVRERSLSEDLLASRAAHGAAAAENERLAAEHAAQLQALRAQRAAALCAAADARERAAALGRWRLSVAEQRAAEDAEARADEAEARAQAEGERADEAERRVTRTADDARYALTAALERAAAAEAACEAVRAAAEAKPAAALTAALREGGSGAAASSPRRSGVAGAWGASEPADGAPLLSASSSASSLVSVGLSRSDAALLAASPVLLSGHLLKRGAARLAYRRRWFELTSHFLTYWLSEADRALGARPRGVVLLRGASAHGGGGGGRWGSDRPFSFTVEYRRLSAGNRQSSQGNGGAPHAAADGSAAGAAASIPGGGDGGPAPGGSRLRSLLAAVSGGRLSAYLLAAESHAEYTTWLRALQQVRALPLLCGWRRHACVACGRVHGPRTG